MSNRPTEIWNVADTVLSAITRIEELEATCKQLEKACYGWSEVSQKNYQRAKPAEARLDAMAKVLVEAMVVPEAWMASGFPDMSSEAKEQITASVMKARTALAELKGKK